MEELSVLQENTGHLFGTDGFFVIGGNAIDGEINVGLLKNAERSGSREAVREKWQHTALPSETQGSSYFRFFYCSSPIPTNNTECLYAQLLALLI